MNKDLSLHSNIQYNHFLQNFAILVQPMTSISVLCPSLYANNSEVVFSFEIQFLVFKRMP